MKEIILQILLFVNAVYSIASVRPYYWRDYDGIVPCDALVVATNFNHKIYAGHAYLHNAGVIVGQIVPGVPTLSALYQGMPVLHQQVKVLCGAADHFTWLKTNSSDLHRVIVTEPVVVAGYQKNNNRGGFVGSLYVGRHQYSNGEHKIGKIHEDTNLMYVETALQSDHDTAARTEYEILLYKPGNTDCNKNKKKTYIHL